MINLTEEEMFEKYGDIELNFSHYHKYTFTYVGDDCHGKTFSALIGGNSDEVYNLEVSCDDVQSIRALYPFYLDVRDALTGEVIECYHE